MTETTCQFNKEWFKRIGIYLAVFVCLLVAGFFVFNFESQKSEPLPFKEENLSAEIGSQASNPVESLSQKDLLLKEKIGQMIMVGFGGMTLADNPILQKQIEEGSVGGVILFDYDLLNKKYQRNIQSKSQLKKLTTDLQSIASTTLFIAIDEEGGMVERLKESTGFKKDISAERMAQEGQKFVFQSGLQIGQELKEVGINMNFAPVVDVNLNPNNPIIGKLGRSFSTSSKEVALMAEQFILGQSQAGVISVVKHFPGHGSSLGDSHLGLVDISLTYKQEELVPYYHLQSKGLLKAVMTAHLVNKNIDPTLPATLSPLFLEDVLREQVGFAGLIVSDDLQMKAVTSRYGFEEAIVSAILAGCNLLVFSNNSGVTYDNEIAQKAVEVIFQAIKEGKIPREKIDTSFRLISTLKETF
ncbi:glycoside hydrolase family 3 [Candidatus Parcubacteria bacterium]|nr:glycoside hydrolase family 3 [Candidatus Parcubacteria bacterium]